MPSFAIQVVIKCNSLDPIIEAYGIVGSCCKGDNLSFESRIMRALSDGWSLYGDHDYS